MKYKKSKYNVEIDRTETGCILIYNTFSGIFSIMDTKTQVIYNNIENINISEIDDQEIKNNINILIKSGYIVSTQKDELATIKLERNQTKYANNVLALTIAPTLACNMRCPYCYENKKSNVMDEKTQEELIEFVKRHTEIYPEIKLLSVYWYGGEPLLQKETIYNLSKKFIEICNNKGIDYRAMIVTNGSLLDKETAHKLFYECKVERTQITVDGMQEKHDKRRIFVDGRGSFDIIINNIENCKDFMPITIRMNIDKKNENDIEKFINYIYNERKWMNNPLIYIAPVDDYGDDSCTKQPSACFANRDFAEVDNQFKKMRYYFDRKSVIKEFFPHRKKVFCGAECSSSYVIDPDGYYYNCWLVIGEKEYRSGHISEPFVFNSEYARWIFNELPKKCEECNYLPMCLGGCTFFRVCKDGQPKCTSTYYGYKDALKLAYEDYMMQKNLQDNGKA